MGKKALSTEEYERLKAFLRLYFDCYMAKAYMKPENHPLAVLERLERRTPSQAKRGLEMAVNDCVEMSSDWTPEQVAAADQRFAGQGVLPLSEVRRRYSRRYLQILKRGSINSDQEYYLLKGVADGSSLEPGAMEREQVEAMLAKYETQAVARAQRKS